MHEDFEYLTNTESIAELLAEIKASGQDGQRPMFWPTHNPRVRLVGIDYGRSHYFFVNGKLSIPKTVHAIYDAKQPPPRLIAKLGVTDLAPFSTPTPLRNALVCRTKFEALAKEIGAEAALVFMCLTTQVGMRRIKARLEELFTEFGQDIQFCFFSLRLDLADDDWVVSFRFVNFLPTTGIWQMKSVIPSNAQFAYEARAVVSLSDFISNQGDLKCTVRTVGKHPNFDKPAERINYGVFEGNNRLPFRDTAPTW